MMWRKKTQAERPEVPYPGHPAAVDGSEAVVHTETLASDAAGVYPITPATQMGEGWALAVSAGKRNVHGRRLVFFEPEGEHAAAAVTAGMSLTGMRAANFSAGQGIAYMHESLYPAVGKRLTYVLNVACRAMTKHSLNVHAGHDDYHAVDDTGFFQVFAKDVQGAADLNLISHRLAELSLNPGICAQDGFLTSHVIESVLLPEPELIRDYLGDPADQIEAPTPAQRLVFGETRRRIPEMYDFDYPAMLGVVQNQDSYAQGVAAQRPFYFDHLSALADRAFEEFHALTGRRYARAMGYRLDDAEYVIAGQGSVVSNAEAVADHLRATRGLKVGVFDLTMFRPFPADQVVALLRGIKAVTVLERVDQPLAVDAPVLREIRAAFSQAAENHAEGIAVHAGIPACAPAETPSFFSGCFGLGSRDLQPGDLVAAVENMLPNGTRRRHFYLGIEFIRDGTHLPKLQIWQDQLLDAYPNLRQLALPRSGDLDLMPDGALSVRIHSVGGWGAITMGKNLALIASELAGLHVKANPKYGSEKKGQPTTFYATLASEPIRLNCELKHVDVVLAPDPNAFEAGDPLAGMKPGGVLVMQSEMEPDALWDSLPIEAQRIIREKNIHFFAVDAFQIAAEEASDANLRYRMQGSAFLGAFFRAAPLLERHGLAKDDLIASLRAQMSKKFGHLGERVVEDNVRVIRRGFEQVAAVDIESRAVTAAVEAAVPVMPAELAVAGAQPGIGHGGRFWEQVCHVYKSGDDGIADPFAAISAIPAGTSTIRDMTEVRYEVPLFLPEACTGCSQCWTQCPDSAIPGNVNTVEEVLYAAMHASSTTTFERLRQVVPHLSREIRRVLKAAPFHDFSSTLKSAYEGLVTKLPLDPERREQLDAEFGQVAASLADFPLARTAPFYEVPEGQEKGSGGLLSITVNPRTCKGCNICVEVCPSGALVAVHQDDAVVDTLRHNWEIWKRLPSTADRYVNVASVEDGIGVLPSMLLKKENYLSMLGGDGACMGCGEKTAVHLVLTAVNALMRPRVAAHVERLDTLLSGLDAKARTLLASDAALEELGAGAEGHVDIPLDASKQARLQRLTHLIEQIKDLRWRYTEGPSGAGRALVGFANSTGCSSVWGSTYPYNPYPFPWVNHLFQDAPSIAVGLFEGHMRKMAEGFTAIRRAELELEDRYDPETHEPFFSHFDWKEFTDHEFGLCPPIFAVGGDGAMLDIGFQNLSRLMTSGKPIRVLVLDTQVYSNTGGQACTSGFHGQVSDMAGFGPEQRGKEEIRKELSLIAMAHREVFIVQSSQANASHLLGGVLRGLQTRHPSVFLLHCPCPPEHGLADDVANRAARLSLESRAFPLLVYDPDAGENVSDCLDLSGNPSIDDSWPTYELNYLDEGGAEQSLSLPLTIADWAASEGRFKKHFRKLAPDAEAVPFHEFLELSVEAREGQVPFIYSLDAQRRLRRMQVLEDIVLLAEERLSYWQVLRHLAGLDVSETVADDVRERLGAEYEQRLAEATAQTNAEVDAFKRTYPAQVARRLAEGLLQAGSTSTTLGDLLERVKTLPALGGANVEPSAMTSPSAPVSSTAVLEPAPAPAAAPSSPDAVEEADDAELVMEPYITSARCTSCDECTNLNNKMFAYNDKKQAYVKDPRAGTFRQLVQAAEKCPVRIIHPGTPLNPKEKDLDKWTERAKAFN